MKMLLSTTLYLAAAIVTSSNLYSADQPAPSLDKIPKRHSADNLARQPHIIITPKAPLLKAQSQGAFSAQENATLREKFEHNQILKGFSQEEKNVLKFFLSLEKGADTKIICKYIYKTMFENAVDYVTKLNKADVRSAMKKTVFLNLYICKDHVHHVAWRKLGTECVSLTKFTKINNEDTLKIDGNDKEIRELLNQRKSEEDKYPFCATFLHTKNQSYIFDSEYHALIKYENEYVYIKDVFSPDTLEQVENLKFEIPYREKVRVDRHKMNHIIPNGGVRAYEFDGIQCFSAHKKERGSKWF